MADCTPASWTVEKIDCFDGSVVSTDTVAGNISSVVDRELVTVLAERVSARDVAEWGGNLDGLLQERVYASSTALRNASVTAAESVNALAGYEVQWPGGAEVTLAESVNSSITFTQASVLSDLFVFLIESVAASNQLVDTPGGGQIVLLNESVIALAESDFLVVYSLLETMKAADAVNIGGWLLRPAEGVSVLDAATAAYLRNLSENVDVADEATVIFMLAELVSVLDKLVSVRYEELEDRVEAIGEVFSVIGELLAETMTADATVLLTRVNEMLESVVVRPGLVLSFPKEMDEAATVTDGVLTAGTIYKLLLEEKAQATAWVRIDGNVAVFCLNPRLGGITTYNGWDFNSYAEDSQGVMWAANSEGAWKITAKPEEAVKSTVRFAKTTFGTEAVKGLQQAFVGMTTDGKLVLSYTNDQGTEAVYQVTPVPGLKTTRIKLGRGSIGRWFEFKLEDIDSTEFSLDEMSLVPIPMSRVMR